MTLVINRAVLGAALVVVLCFAAHAVSAQARPADLSNVRPDASEVVVKQGNVSVTLADVDTWMLDVPEKDRSGFIRSPERIESMLFQLLLMKQINQEARANKLDQQPQIARHMELAAERTLARYQTDVMRSAIKAPDLSDLVKEKYLATPDVYREPDIATVVHLLITENKRGSDAAKALIDKLHKQAQKNPSKLEEIAVKYSEDSSVANNRGQLKDASLATLDAEFAKAARSLQPGQLSAPVKSQFGWHIIRLDAITRGRLPEFDEIKQALVAAAEQEYIARSFRAYLDGLRQRALDPNPDVISKLPFRYGGEAEPAAAPAASATDEAK